MDAFFLKTETADGCPCAVAGFTPAGMSGAAKDKLCGALSGQSFRSCRSGFLADVMMADTLRRCGEGLLLAAASIALPFCSQNGGGIIGIPSEDSESATESVSTLWEGMQLLTFPGSLGIALETGMAEAEDLFFILSSHLEKLPMSREFVQSACRLVQDYSDTWLLTADGCGNQCGAVFIGESGAAPQGDFLGTKAV